jgi:acyl dehydratase
MRVFSTLADYAEAAGEVLGTSGWVTIGQDRIDTFAAATGDHQWIHVDPERTRAELGMETIAHGYLTLALVPLFVAEIVKIESVRRSLNYGSNKIRFLNMVPAGSKLRGSARLDRAVLSDNSLRSHMTVTVEIEGQEKPALIAETIALLFE